MNQAAPFMVATLGFEERERNLVRDLLRISEYRTPTFRALVKDSGQSPQIVLVNADRADALAKWEAYQRANAGKRRIPAVMWIRKPAARPSPLAQAHKYTLDGPAVLSHLFDLLERVVSEEHGFRRTVATDGGQRMFVMSAEELTADRSATPQHTATVVIDLPPQPPASSRAAAVGPPIGSASAGVVGTASVTGAPPASEATEAIEIAVIIEPEVVTTPTSDTGSESGITAAAHRSSADIRVAREPAPAPPAPPTQTRILVVDDSLPVRIQMKEALQKFAKTIDFAHDAEQAMILIDNCKYDVIFLDVILPGKDGYDVCRYIRSHPLQRQTPVIMLTSNSAPADRVKGKLAGCDTYLIKPVRQSVLAEVVGFIQSSAVA